MNVLHTPMCDLFGTSYPIVLADMGAMAGRMVPPAGQGGWRLHKVEPAISTCDHQVREPLEALDRLSTIASHHHVSAT